MPSLIIPNSQEERTTRLLEQLTAGIQNLVGEQNRAGEAQQRIGQQDTALMQSQQQIGIQQDAASRAATKAGRSNIREDRMLELINKYGKLASKPVTTEPKEGQVPDPLSTISDSTIMERRGVKKKEDMTNLLGQMATEKEDIRTAALLGPLKGQKEEQQSIQRGRLEAQQEGNRLRAIGESRRQMMAGWRIDEAGKQKVLTAEKQFLADPQVKKARAGIDAIQTARDVINSGNPLALSVATRLLARIAGEVGVMTDKDVAAFGGSKAITDRISALAKEISVGRITENNVGFMTEIIDVMELRHNENIVKFAQKKADRTTQIIGIEPDSFRDFLLIGDALKPTEEGSPLEFGTKGMVKNRSTTKTEDIPKGQVDYDDMTPEEIEEEFNKSGF